MILSALRGGIHGARWVDPQNYHLTLRFIGDIDDRTANDIADMLDGVQRAPFEVTLTGLDHFGGKKPRAIFAAATPSPSLTELQYEHERIMQRLGLPPEPRKFTPHVTLARLRDASGMDVADYLSSRRAFRAIRFPVNRFVLYSSRASTGGGPYIVEADYPLRGRQGLELRHASAM